MRRRARFDAVADASRGAARAASTAEPAAVDDESARGRPAAADLHLLPSGAAADAQVALTLREVCGLTTEEIARAFLTRAADDRAAHRARQGEDPRRAHPVPGPGARRAARAARRACCTSSTWCSTRATRPPSGDALTRHDLSRRGDPAGPAAGRAAARARGDRAAGADAAARVAARRAHLAGGRAVLLADQDRSLWDRDADRRGRWRWSSGRWRRGASGPTRSRRRSPRVHAEAPDGGGDRLGGRSSACTTCCCASTRRRWSS